jgi:hypothetical protein
MFLFSNPGSKRRRNTQHNDIQHKDTHPKGLVCETLHNNAMHYAEWNCAEFCVSFIVMLSVLRCMSLC